MKKRVIWTLPLAVLAGAIGVACGEVDASDRPVVYVEAGYGSNTMPLELTFPADASAALIERVAESVRVMNAGDVEDGSVAMTPALPELPNVRLVDETAGELVFVLPVNALAGVEGFERYIVSDEGKLLILLTGGGKPMPDDR